MWNSKETFPKCIFQFTSMPQFTFSPTTFIPKAYFYKNKPKGLKVTKEDPRLIGSMRVFCDKYIHIFFSISTSFSLYPHLFEYIHIPHYYIHIFSSISTSVVTILESLSRLKKPKNLHTFKLSLLFQIGAPPEEEGLGFTEIFLELILL